MSPKNIKLNQKRYRKVSPSIWNDKDFMAMSDDGQLVFLFLLTHPFMTGLGAMRSNIPGLATEKGWALKRFEKAFNEPVEKEMVQYDHLSSCVFLPNFTFHNRPESPNAVKGLAKAVDLIPECELRDTAIIQLYQVCKDMAEAFSEAFKKAFGEAFTQDFGKTLLNNEQEQEQEQEKNNMSGKDTRRRIPYKEIVTILNTVTGQEYQSETAATKNLIKARWNEGHRLIDFQLVIESKFTEWGTNPDYVKYLRPSTLFGPKFEGYLQAAKKIKPGGNKAVPAAVTEMNLSDKLDPDSPETFEYDEITFILNYEKAVPGNLAGQYMEKYGVETITELIPLITSRKAEILQSVSV